MIGAPFCSPYLFSNISMNTVQIIITASITIAILGFIIEMSSGRKKRTIQNDSGGKPTIIHRNCHLVGKFSYKAGLIRYQCFCIGPLVLMPLGCYLCDKKKEKKILSSQKMYFSELFALYSRWGWIVAFFTILSDIK